jgi:hypothetical protein
VPGGLNASATRAALDASLQQVRCFWSCAEARARIWPISLGVVLQAEPRLVACWPQLQLAYVDLMLLHWPGGGRAGRKEQWRALEEWAKQGGAKAIGVSHYCRCRAEFCRLFL